MACDKVTKEWREVFQTIFQVLIHFKFSAYIISSHSQDEEYNYFHETYICLEVLKKKSQMVARKYVKFLLKLRAS